MDPRRSRARPGSPALPALLAFAALACSSAPPPLPRIGDEPLASAQSLGSTLCISGALHTSTLRTPSRLRDEIAALRAVGATAARFDVRWTDVEREVGRYDLDWLDAPFAALRDAGIRPIVLLGYGHPAYARDSHGDHFFPPDDPAPFAAYARAVAGRLCGEALAFELWNEPNAGYRFWKPLEDPPRFARLVAAARAAIDEACPGATSLFGGVFWHAEVVMGGVEFIRRAYEAEPSLREGLPGLAVHPYSYYPPEAPPDDGTAPEVPLVEKLSLATRATGAAGVQTWITEIGWPLYGRVDAQTQASYVTKTFALAAEAGARVTCWYELIDGPMPTAFPPEDAFGLLAYDPGGPAGPAATPKPAHAAFRALARLAGELVFSRSRREELGLTGERENALFFRDGEGRRAVTILWTTPERAGRVATIPLHEGATPRLYAQDGGELPLRHDGRAAKVTLPAAPVLLVESLE